MGPQIILAMNTTKSTLYRRRCSSAASRLCDVTAASTQPVIRRVRSPAAQRSPSVLFAPPQQQWRLLHSSASFLLHSMCAPISNTHTHTVFLLSVQNQPQQRSSRSINRFAASQSSTAIATIENHSATPDDDRHTIERRAVQQQQSTNNDRTPRSAVFCNNTTTIIMIECHAALQCNNQQPLSQTTTVTSTTAR
jgi:hypothetical protein